MENDVCRKADNVIKNILFILFALVFNSHIMPAVGYQFDKKGEKMNKQKLKSCPFCGAKPIEIVFDTHKSGRPAGYVLKIEHQAQCFIEHMSYA